MVRTSHARLARADHRRRACRRQAIRFDVTVGRLDPDQNIGLRGFKIADAQRVPVEWLSAAQIPPCDRKAVIDDRRRFPDQVAELRK